MLSRQLLTNLKTFFFNYIIYWLDGILSKSTQSNSRTAYRPRVRVRGNSDNEK